MLPVIDLHCDTLTAFMDPGRSKDTLDDPNSQFALSKLSPELRWGQCFAIWIPDGLTPRESADYYAFHQRSFQAQMERLGDRVLPCRTAGDIEAAWARGKTAALLTVENGSALAGELGRVETLARDGVRMVTLTWNGENQLGSGHDTQTGLTPFGKQAVRAMEEAGILVDVSHLNDRGFSDLLDTARRPFTASHSNARAVCSHRRNLADWQVRELVSRRCLIGLNYYSPFLREDGQPAQLEDLLHHAEHLLELGAEDCLALGSDFDGADLPPCLDSPEKAARLDGFFRSHGFPPRLCRKILYENALSFFRENLR